MHTAVIHGSSTPRSPRTHARRGRRCPRGRLVHVLEQGGQRVLGFGPADVGTDGWIEHYGVFIDDHGTLATLADLPLNRALCGETPPPQALFIRNASRPESVWISVTAAPIRSPEGVAGAIAVFRDETAERQSEQLSRALDEERAEHIRSKEIANIRRDFLLSFSHELRTPLTSIVGYSDLLLDDDFDPSTAREYIEVVNWSAVQLRRLIDDIFELQRVFEGHTEISRNPASLRSLIASALTGIDVGRRCLELHVADATVCVDEKQVQRAIEHLVRNAVTHTPEGAHVSVSGEPFKDELAVAVEDDGPGVPENLREEVFLPFRHAPGARRVPGPGIGLALVRHCALVHGGRAWVEDSDAGGARFVVRLPAA